MPERESLTGNSIQNWKGLNERSQPTLVTDGFFTRSYGVFFNTDGVVKLFGKRLAGKLAGPIFNIFQVNKIALVQTTTALWSIPVDELSGFLIIQPPETPLPPIIYDISYTSLTVQAPPSYPAHTISFSLQERWIDVTRSGGYPDDPQSWTTIDVATDPDEVVGRTGLHIGGIYEYRCVAINSYGTTYSPVARVQLFWAAPAVNAPTFANVLADDFDILVPAIPSVTVFTVLLLTGADPNNLADYTSIGGTCEKLTTTTLFASDLISPVISNIDYTLRYAYTLKKADGTFIDIVTPASVVHTLAGIKILTWVSNGDTNDLFYFLGTAYNTVTWSNPYPSQIGIQIKTLAVFSADELVDRTTDWIQTTSAVNNWVGFDIGSGRTLVVDKYSIRNYNSTNWVLQTWKLQGSNNVAGTSIAAYDAATWVDLDTQSLNALGAAFAWKTLTLGSVPAGYRWFRIIQTGNNSSGGTDINISEVQFYGTLTY